MSFFYDLNKKLDSIRATPEVTHKQLNERDEGKPGKNFAKIAKDAGERYGSKAAGERVAGSIRNKLRDQGKLEEEGMSRAAKGYEKYGREGMEALAKAGREGKSLDPVRQKYNKYDESQQVDEISDQLAYNVNQSRAEQHFAAKDKADAAHQQWARGDNSSMKQAQNVSTTAQAARDARSKLAKNTELQKSRGNRLGKQMYEPATGRDTVSTQFRGTADMGLTRMKKPEQQMNHNYEESLEMAEGGSYLNYADSAAENPAPPKKPMAAPAPKPQGVMDKVKSIGKRVAGGINQLVGHGSDEEMRKDLQRKSGAPVTGKKPEQKTTEAAKYRDPKYKDKLYTVEPLDYTYGPDADELYYNPKPDDYEGRKRKIGGGEFSHNDPLRKGFGRGGASNSINTHGKRKGLPSRDQITSLKGSIKDASGTHAQPNLPEAGAPMTAKQKSFAKLAPPADKITFADKIAGAKKEVDEMLGQVAADAMRSAVGKSSEQRAQQQDDDFVNDHYAKARNNRRVDAEDQWARSKGRNPGAEMDEERSKGTAFDMSTPRAATPKVGSVERGHKHDIKHTATGRMVTRRVDDQGNSVGADDDSDTQAGPRGRGRPKGTKGAIGAKGPSGRSKLMTKEGDQEDGELKAAMALLKKAGYKVSKAMGEESTHTGDDHAEKAGKKVTKDIEYDEKKKDGIHGKKRGAEDAKAEKAGKKVAKDIEYDEKKKDKEVDESTTSGSVATSTATKGGGSMVGKGIYDSMNRELENMIAESMSINMSDSTEGGKSLTITATDEDALKLGMLLKSAGLGGGDAHGGDMHSHSEEPCDTCGMPDCGCGDVQEAVDENSPDWPTNTETSNNAMQYAGGLNKPKTDVAGDGQTTVPNTAVHTQDEDALRRMMEMAGLAEDNMPMVKKDGKMVPAFAADGKGENDLEAKDKEEDTVEESIRRMMEIAGVKKKPMDEEKTDEGNKFAFNVLKAKEAGKKQADLDGDGDMEKVRESIFALNNQWQAYKG